MTNPKPHSQHLKVKLYEEHGETSVFVNAKIKDNGDLVVFGQDIGKATLEFWGDSDYEYSVTVLDENKDRVLKALIEHCDQVGVSLPSASRNKDKALLTFLKRVYVGHSEAVEEFRDFLEASGIPFDWWTYA